MNATAWLDVGAAIAASFAKRIVAMSMPGHATVFLSTQLELYESC